MQRNARFDGGTQVPFSFTELRRTKDAPLLVVQHQLAVTAHIRPGPKIYFTLIVGLSSTLYKGEGPRGNPLALDQLEEHERLQRL